MAHVQLEPTVNDPVHTQSWNITEVAGPDKTLTCLNNRMDEIQDIEVTNSAPELPIPCPGKCSCCFLYTSTCLTFSLSWSTTVTLLPLHWINQTLGCRHHWGSDTGVGLYPLLCLLWHTCYFLAQSLRETTAGGVALRIHHNCCAQCCLSHQLHSATNSSCSIPQYENLVKHY